MSRSGRWVVALLALAGCHEGDGSDTGPRLTAAPVSDYRVAVRDDAGNPITGARITFSGSGGAAVTGRTGRASLRPSLGGSRVVTIDGSSGAAKSASVHGAVAIAATLPDGGELPFVVHLPDGAGSAAATIASGVQGAAIVVDDSDADPDRNGGILTVASGDAVTAASGATTITLRTGRLSIGRLPPHLAGTTGTPMVTSHGVFVFPADVQFAAGARLSFPAAGLNPTAGQFPRLFRLDPTTGVWVDIGTGQVSGGRIETGVDAIKVGGLYCMALAQADVAAVAGVVLDREQRPVPRALVRGPQATTRTGSDGRFTLTMPRLDAAGNPRSVVVEVTGGRDYLPTRAAYPVTTLAAADVDLGTLVLDTRPSASGRILVIHRGTRQPRERVRVSTFEGLAVDGANAGADGVVEIEDLAAETAGFLSTRVLDPERLRRMWGRFFLSPFVVDNPITLFSGEEAWRSSNARGTLLQVGDAFGTGPIEFVQVMRGSEPDRGHIGRTDFNGLVGASAGLDEVVTLARETASDGRTVVSAFSFIGTASGRQEVPIERALRTQLGTFDRFGMYEGMLTDTGSGDTRRIRRSGVMVLQDFYDDALMGRGATLRAPVALAPTVPPPAAGPHFRLGVPRGVGHLVAVEGATTGGQFAAQRFGLATNLSVTEGTTATQDVALQLLADTTFRIEGAYDGLDPVFGASDITFAAAAERTDGLLVDLVRGARPTQDGTAALIPLPALAAWNAGFASYLVVHGGAQTAGGVTLSQKIFTRLDGATTVLRRPLALPTLAVDANPAATGFKAMFAAPQDSDYLVLRLRYESTTEIRDWTALLPVDATEFTFHQVPDPLPEVLATKSDPGDPWTLTLTCVRIDEGPLADDALTKDEVYWRVQANFVALQEAGRVVTAISSRSIQLNTNGP